VTGQRFGSRQFDVRAAGEWWIANPLTYFEDEDEDIER
jgi:hypothetical protein